MIINYAGCVKQLNHAVLYAIFMKLLLSFIILCRYKFEHWTIQQHFLQIEMPLNLLCVCVLFRYFFYSFTKCTLHWLKLMCNGKFLESSNWIKSVICIIQLINWIAYDINWEIFIAHSLWLYISLCLWMLFLIKHDFGCAMNRNYGWKIHRNKWITIITTNEKYKIICNFTKWLFISTQIILLYYFLKICIRKFHIRFNNIFFIWSTWKSYCMMNLNF